MSKHNGAGSHGTGVFMAQRVTALGLLILLPWFIVTLALSMPDTGYVSASDFLTRPFEAIGLVLLLGVGLYHMRIGMGEIIEDYIHKDATRSALMLLNTFVVAALGAAALYALYVINFGD